MKVPEGWKRVRLGEIVIENSKSPFKVEEADNDGSYHFFTSGEEILKHSKYLIDDENIFISTGGTAYVNYYNGKSSYSADTYSLKSRINTLYLYYFLYRRLNHITFRYFIGSGLEHLQKQDFKNSFEVTFPIDFNEQQKIAEILETVDRAIEKTDKIIEKYKRIKQGLMQDLLTKGIDENGKIRSEKTHKFKNSPLGRIPEEWEVERAEEVFYLITDYVANGSFATLKKNVVYSEIEDYAILIRLIDFNNDFKGPFIYVNKSAYDFLIKTKLVPEDIIISNVGAYAGLVFKVKNINKPMTLGPNAILVRTNQIRDFIYYWLKSNIGQNCIQLIISITAQPKFNKTDFRKLLIPLPPLPEQQRIAEILSQIDNTIEKEEAYKQKLDRIKKGLMEDLLTGRVRVNKLIKEKEIEYA